MGQTGRKAERHTSGIHNRGGLFTALHWHLPPPPTPPHTLQVCAQVLSGGGDMDPEVLAINAVSAALMCSDIPWAGPAG